MQCGPIRVRIRPKDINQQLFRHIVVVRKTPFNIAAEVGEQPIQTIYTALANDVLRNQMILKDIRDALRERRSPLVLTERREHLEFLAAELRKDTSNVIVMHGGMGKKQRAAVDEQIKSVSQTERRTIVATGRYAGEGFDDARLDTLFLALPISWRGTLQQYAGRLHRTHTDKREVCVYDYVDDEVPVLARMFAKRAKGYRAMGYVAEDDGVQPLLSMDADPTADYAPGNSGKER
jgi:superfamily II DNA or RNA helicase